MASRNDHLGSKLGPRLASLMTQATITARMGLADTEHRLRVHSTREIVDWMGLELGAIMTPLVEPTLRDGKLPPEIHRALENITSGKNQWQALAGIAYGASGVPGMLGTIMNNYLAHWVYDAVGAAPMLVPDLGTLTALASRGVITEDRAIGAAGGLGYNSAWVRAMISGAKARPALNELWELHRRGLLDNQDAYDALLRAGFEEHWIQPLLTLYTTPLTVADAALALLRGNIDEGRAEEIARHNGVSPSDLHVVVDNTGEPPAVEELVGLWRRGHLSEAELERGVRQSRMRNEWIPAIKQLGVIPPSPADALDAYLKGQIPEGEARRRFTEGGGDPTWFTDAYHAAGEAPTPDQLAVMANRGIIPWSGTGPDSVSFEQGFLEGPWRNKWLPVFRKASQYLPPPRTVTALLNEGAITRERAVQLLMEQGLSADLAHAYTLESSHTKTKKQRDLAVGQIETLYADQAIDAGQAEAMLVSLGYDTAEAKFILTIQDLKRVTEATTQAIGRIHTQYTNHVIDRSTASGLLDSLSVPAAQRDGLLGTWDIERSARVRVLTEAQVVRALKKGLIDAPGAVGRLVHMGYSETDAAVLIQL